MLAQVIKSWLDCPAKTSYSDDLRCAAWEIQEEYPLVTSKDFSEAAALFGVNPATARRCWSYVKSQEA